MKILYVMTVSSTMKFFKEHIKMLLAEGHTVEVTANFEQSSSKYCYDLGLKIHHIPFSRSPFSFANFTAYKQLKKLVYTGKYDIVHTHTPNASACARLACRKLRRQGLKVFYTAHGFHFYKGAPMKNWLVYYPVEWLCARWTDVLITINQEDYALAQKHMHAKKIVYVPGVGINLAKFNSTYINRIDTRKQLNIPEKAVVLISVGELNENKNHETIIKAIKSLDVFYVIAGVGNKREYLQRLIDNQNMTDQIQLLGYRTDIKELYAASDMFVFPSFREGLSVALMEAMASGLPCVVSKIRGNTDLIDEHGGAFFDPYNIDSCKNAIQAALSRNLQEMGAYNVQKIEQFDLASVIGDMKSLYSTEIHRE